MAKELFNYIAIGDIHFGHTNTTTEHIIESFNQWFKTYMSTILKTNAIFLEGDVFDKLLGNSSTDYILAMEWLYNLAIFCSKHKIKLRILRGTLSHDWNQLRLVEKTFLKLKTELDFKYIQTLHIEHMSDFNIDVLYVPDEYKHDASDTFKDVQALLVEKGLTSVDIAIMHGNFSYQLPIKTVTAHDENSYLNIVKYYITINHIHTSSIFDRIIAPGSFDRLAHGEEEDKGCVHITLFKDGSKRFSFLKNTLSKIYKTINCFDLSLDDIFSKIDKGVRKLPLNSFIRLKINSDTRLSKNVEDFTKKYEFYTFKIESEKDKGLTNGSNITDIEIPLESFHITPENIEELLLEELRKQTLSEIELDTAIEELRRAIEKL